jgi:hypothetical protein
MTQSDFIRDSIGRMERLKLSYCITGSIASNYYGIPRLTHDMDIIIVLLDKEIEPLADIFSKDYYIEKEDIKEARKAQGMFNIIHHSTGLKIDFWFLKDNEFSRNMFSRRQRVEIIAGVQAWIATAEDVILAKLIWNKATPSEKQLNDAKGVLEVQKERLDMAYLKDWAKELGLTETLERVMKANLPNQT